MSCSNRDRPIVPKLIWKEKRIAEEIRAAYGTMDDKGSKNSEDICTGMDVNMVFPLPAKFRAPKA